MKALSPKEVEVVKLIVGECLASKEIAPKLNISISHVKNYRKSIFAKLDIDNELKLARWAITTGLVSWDKK